MQIFKGSLLMRVYMNAACHPQGLAFTDLFHAIDWQGDCSEPERMGIQQKRFMERVGKEGKCLPGRGGMQAEAATFFWKA